MKIVNSAYMSQGHAVPSKIYHPTKNNYVPMYLFSINTHTFTCQTFPKTISCKQYYSWPMVFSLSLFTKKTWRQWRTCVSWAVAAWTSTGAWNYLNTLRMVLTTVLVFPIILMLLLQHLRPWKPPMKIHVHSKQCIIQHSQAIYHSCCSLSTHCMAPPHRYASFPSIPNHDHHLTKINRCNTVTAHVQNDAPATRCELSLYYKKNKKKQGKIMTLPGVPTKT